MSSFCRRFHQKPDPFEKTRSRPQQKVFRKIRDDPVVFHCFDIFQCRMFPQKSGGIALSVEQDQDIGIGLQKPFHRRTEIVFFFPGRIHTAGKMDHFITQGSAPSRQ